MIAEILQMALKSFHRSVVSCSSDMLSDVFDKLNWIRLSREQTRADPFEGHGNYWIANSKLVQK
jgi:hypothetical protein